MSTPPSRVSKEIRSARANRRPPSFVVTLTALAIVCALAWMFFVRTGDSTPAPVVAGIEGTYTWHSGTRPLEAGAFSAVEDGDAGGRYESLKSGFGSQPGLDSAYSAGRRTETTLEGLPSQVVQTVGEWPPVWRVATRSPLDYQGLSAIVRTAVEDGDHSVGIKPLKQGDRAVWRAAMTLGGRQIALVVDQETGIVTWCSDGDDRFTATVAWDSPPAPGTTYKVQLPTQGTRLGRPHKKHAAVSYAETPAAAGRQAGYDPLVSDLAPDGYALKAVATMHEAYAPLVWLGAGDSVNLPIPPRLDEDTVAELYTRGLSWFTAEQVGPKVRALYHGGFDQWLQPPTGSRLSYQETTLQYGAFTGKTALTWYQPSGPSLFVSGARRAVFVTGALTRQELIAFAEGLKPVPADAAP